jgi:hypothetical protein
MVMQPKSLETQTHLRSPEKAIRPGIAACGEGLNEAEGIYAFNLSSFLVKRRLRQVLFICNLFLLWSILVDVGGRSNPPTAPPSHQPRQLLPRSAAHKTHCSPLLPPTLKAPGKGPLVFLSLV